MTNAPYKALNYAGNRLLARVCVGDARKCIACGGKQAQQVPRRAVARHLPVSA